jgi:hypothetical protein
LGGLLLVEQVDGLPGVIEEDFPELAAAAPAELRRCA